MINCGRFLVERLREVFQAEFIVAQRLLRSFLFFIFLKLERAICIIVGSRLKVLPRLSGTMVLRTL